MKPIVTVTLLSSLVIVVRTASVASRNNVGRDAWLEDYEKAARQNDADAAWMQADSPFSSSSSSSGRRKTSKQQSVSLWSRRRATCPPLSRDAALAAGDHRCRPADGGGSASTCETDDDCRTTAADAAAVGERSAAGRKCCYDGCRRTCVAAVQPPPYVDWQYEPRMPFAPGNSWLIRGMKEEPEVEWCSTSYSYDADEEEPLMCPHGYICRVDEHRAPSSSYDDDDVPNRGRCVRQTPVEHDGETLLRVALAPAADGMCIISSHEVYNNGDTFRYGKHLCKCEDGSVMCRVGRDSSRHHAATPDE